MAVLAVTDGDRTQSTNNQAQMITADTASTAAVVRDSGGSKELIERSASRKVSHSWLMDGDDGRLRLKSNDNH